VKLTAGRLGKKVYVWFWKVSQLAMSLVLMLSFDASDALMRKTVSLNWI
jgi:hypothetical protein